MEVMFCFLTDEKQHKARELDMITRDLERPWHDYDIICNYDATGTDFENSLYAFGQSEKSFRVQCIIIRANNGGIE